MIEQKFKPKKQKKEKKKKEMLTSLWQYSLLTIYSGILYENFNYCATYEI